MTKPVTKSQGLIQQHFSFFITFSILLFVFMTDALASRASEVQIPYFKPAWLSVGGRWGYNMSFGLKHNGQARQTSNSQIRMAGWTYLHYYQEIYGDSTKPWIFEADFSTSFDESATGRLKQNQVYISTKHHKYGQLITGYIMSAAGYGHLTLPSTGTPFIGLDNEAVSFLPDGLYTTKISENFTRPFAGRVYYETPEQNGKSIAVSYSPGMQGNNPFNYKFHLQHRTGQEFSISWNIKQKWLYSGFLHLNAGIIAAFYNGFWATATQYSLRWQHENWLIGAANGCMEEIQEKPRDCRWGMAVEYHLLEKWRLGGGWIKRQHPTRKQITWQLGAEYHTSPGFILGTALQWNEAQSPFGHDKFTLSMGLAINF